MDQSFSITSRGTYGSAYTSSLDLDTQTEPDEQIAHASLSFFCTVQVRPSEDVTRSIMDGEHGGLPMGSSGVL